MDSIHRRHGPICRKCWRIHKVTLRANKQLWQSYRVQAKKLKVLVARWCQTLRSLNAPQRDLQIHCNLCGNLYSCFCRSGKDYPQIHVELQRTWNRQNHIGHKESWKTHTFHKLQLSNRVVKVKFKCQSLSRVWLFAAPWTVCSSSVPGIFQARILEWVAISFSRKELGPQIIRCSEEQKCVLTNY